MDADTLKASISAVSALVALVSAIWAYRARFQTRTDLFYAARDSLILAMAENDALRDVLALKVAYARAEVARVHPGKTTSPSSESEATEFLAHLTGIEALTKVLDQRQYKPDALDEFSYSEDRLSTIRTMARNEQVNAKLLSPAAYDVIFSAIAAFVKRNE